MRTAAQAGEGVVATRPRARYKYIEEALDLVKAMKSLRSAVEGVGFGATFPFTFAFLFYEQYDIIIRAAITTLSLAFTAVVIITLLIVADVREEAEFGAFRQAVLEELQSEWSVHEIASGGGSPFTV